MSTAERTHQRQNSALNKPENQGRIGRKTSERCCSSLLFIHFSRPSTLPPTGALQVDLPLIPPTIPGQRNGLPPSLKVIVLVLELFAVPFSRARSQAPETPRPLHELACMISCKLSSFDHAKGS